MRWVAGEGAVRFDPMDVDELERVITRFMTRDDLCQEYARRGRERAHDFTWERTARETLAVYDEVLSKPVRG
jgi:glycosyltransferase involved in cell wall biosynthesis